MKHSNARRRIPARQGLRSVFAAPLAIALASAVALVSALTGDGWRDWISWIGLAMPVLVTGWAMAVRRG